MEALSPMNSLALQTTPFLSSKQLQL